MRFRSGAKLDPSQVTDVRGRGGMGGPVLAGGGGLGVVGLVIFVLYMVLSGGSGAGGLGSLDGQSVSTGAPSTLGQDCQTGADANERQDCRIVADVNSIQAYWKTAVRGYTPAKTVFYTDSVQTGCGYASSQVGPFYCPADKQVYIDLGFSLCVHFIHHEILRTSSRSFLRAEPESVCSRSRKTGRNLLCRLAASTV